MRNSVKLVFILALVVAMVFAFAACGGEGGGDTDNGSVKGDIINAGNVSALCPSGWINAPQYDILAEDKNTIYPNMLYFYKSNESVENYASYPFVCIILDSINGVFEEVKGGYDNVIDLDPIEINGATWTGFIGDRWVGETSALLLSSDQRCWVEVDLTDHDGTALTLEDADVLAILESVTY